MSKTMTAAMTAAVLAAPEVHGGKRWICDVWASQEELLAAARAGIVELTRCDLACAFDGAKQSASEMSYLTATWHFVRLA